MKHSWHPAYSITKSRHANPSIRPCILRWHDGGLEQLYVCRESRQAKWKKVQKKKEKQYVIQ